MKKNMHQQQGFTLVELSIVLVIIGLIVSGILVGQDMIRAAEIRSTVSQVEQFNTAVNTFRDKYRNLPGDILNSDAVRFGFVTRAGTTGQGDGNRLIQSGPTPADQRNLGFETALFWRDLSFARLIGNNFVTATDAAAATLTAAQVADYLPTANIGQGNYFTIHTQDGRNQYSIAQVTGTGAAGLYSLNAGITPQVAFNIDDKMDDGVPTTGIVVATFSPSALGTVIPIAANDDSLAAAIAVDISTAAHALACAYDSDAGAPIAPSYATSNRAAPADAETIANRPACQLRVRSSF
jgi:prepilin-type N-terminal cleavage/methylation domain-containing protein